MKRILKNEVGRCKYCSSSVVISPFYVDQGRKRHIVYGGACCNKDCGAKTAGTDTLEKATSLIKNWGILAS